MRTGTRLAMALVLAVLAAGCDDTDEPKASGPIAAARVSQLMPLPPSGFAAEWGLPGVPATVPPGARFGVGLPVKNVSDQLWADPRHGDFAKAWGSGAVRLTWRWWSADGKTAVTTYLNSPRGDLVTPVPPGEMAVFAVLVTAPSEPGRYQLQLELLQENVHWFEDMGVPRLLVPVTVAEAAGAKGQK